MVSRDDVVRIFTGWGVRTPAFSFGLSSSMRGEPYFLIEIFGPNGEVEDCMEQELSFSLPGVDEARVRAHAEAVRSWLASAPLDLIVGRMPHELMQLDLLGRDLDAAAMSRIIADKRASTFLRSAQSSRSDVVVDPAVRKPPVQATLPDLEASLLVGDNLELSRIYADWLLDQGDPRGELIELNISRELADDAALRVREAALLDEYQYEFLGELAWSNDALSEVTFRRGFPYAVRAGYRDRDGEDLGDVTARELVSLPKYEHVRHLKIHLRTGRPDAWLADLTLPSALEEFTLRCDDELEHFERFAGQLSRVRRLSICADMTQSFIADLRRCPMPSLEHLELEFPESHRYFRDDLFLGNVAPKLHSLTLRHFELVPTLSGLAEDPMLARLRILELIECPWGEREQLVVDKTLSRFEHLASFTVLPDHIRATAPIQLLR